MRGSATAFTAVLLGVTGSGAAHAADCGVTFGAAFASSYTCNNIGHPTDVPNALGGITFLNAGTLLVGGAANGGGGVIDSIAVVRDASGHITGFGGSATQYATAPQIDGGLQFGPGGVLFATGYPNNTLLQYLPGATTPSKTITLAGVSSSVGTLAFVPAGFAGAGSLKIASYNSGNWYDAVLTPDGTGTYDVATTLATNVTGGPEGIVYVSSGNAGFSTDSVLVSEYVNGSVGAYAIDANGDPTGTRTNFLSGLSGVEGAVIDPLTGDFIFSSFNSANSIYVISGFVAPPPPSAVPETPSWAAMIAGFGLLGAQARRRRPLAQAA